MMSNCFQAVSVARNDSLALATACHQLRIRDIQRVLLGRGNGPLAIQRDRASLEGWAFAPVPRREIGSAATLRIRWIRLALDSLVLSADHDHSRCRHGVGLLDTAAGMIAKTGFASVAIPGAAGLLGILRKLSS
jgi:hypothetical protein